MNGDWAKEIKHRQEVERENHNMDLAEARLAPFHWAMILINWAMILVTLCIIGWSKPSEAADAHLMLKIMKCESGMRYNAAGDDGVSRGIAQFRKETFYEFAAMSKRDKTWNKRGLGKPSWMNPAQQVFLLEWGLDHGYGKRWTCYRKIMARRNFPPMDSLVAKR